MIHYSVVNLWKYAVLQIYPSVSYSLHSVSKHYQIKISKGGEEGGGNETFCNFGGQIFCVCVCVCVWGDGDKHKGTATTTTTSFISSVELTVYQSIQSILPGFNSNSYLSIIG